MNHKKFTVLGKYEPVRSMEDIVQQVTIYDIAQEAGVSSATVSRAISGKGYVSAEKRAVILKIVEKYNFRPNTFAQSLKSGYTKTIGFIVPNIGNMYFANLYYEFEKKASEHGYLTMLLNSNGDYETESRLFRSLLEKNVDGIIMTGGRLDAVQLEEKWIQEVQELSARLPIVMCGGLAARFECPGVYTDDTKGVELLLELLKKQGCQSVCFIGGSNRFFPSYSKKESALRFGKKMGMEIEVHWEKEGPMFNYEAGFLKMRELLTQKIYPDAVCGANDYVAAGAMKAAIQAGLRVPQDILIAGFDDVDICKIQTPLLTSVSPRYESFGRKTFKSLEKLMQGKEISRTAAVLVRPEVIARESTKRNVLED